MIRNHKEGSAQMMRSTSYSTVFYGRLMVFQRFSKGAGSECSVLTLVYVFLTDRCLLE